MLKYLKKTLADAQKERDVIVAPYDKRIRMLKAAITSLEGFDSITDEINMRLLDPATKLKREEQKEKSEEK